MPAKGNKRQALQTPSPVHPSPVKEMDNADIHAKLDLLCGTMASIDTTVKSLDIAVKSLVQENAAIRAELAIKDEKIQSLTDQCNKLDQQARSSSLRIIGLDVSTQSSPTTIHDAVYKEILLPILTAAQQAGDIVNMSNMPSHFIISNSFAIPSKKNTGKSTVIVKLHSEAIRSLVFRYKKTALPTTTDLSSNRVRNVYSIFEDLSPASHAQFRNFSDDIRVKSVWSFGGQIRFKLHDNEQVYKAKSLADTVDSTVKPAG
jgi:hypothetical protein